MNLKGRNFLIAFVWLGLALIPGVTSAQVPGYYSPIYNFTGSISGPSPDGLYPYGGVAFDSAGNMYGTTTEGGENHTVVNGFVTIEGGIVWEITVAGVYKVLHSFGGTVINANGKSGPDGTAPEGAVGVDASGNIYGIAQGGGAYDTGVSFGSITGDGMIWEITAAGKYLDIHDFGGTATRPDGSSGADGVIPVAGVSLDKHGNLYGTATAGGWAANVGNGGMVWEITSEGAYLDLHDFNPNATVNYLDGAAGDDGSTPNGGVNIDGQGNVYGTTYWSGENSTGNGIAWKMGPNGGNYVVLHNFGVANITYTNGETGPDGNNPNGGATVDSAGNIYGTTQSGGAGGGSNGGIVWEITAGGTYKDIHDFGGTCVDSYGLVEKDGYYPEQGVTVDAIGNLYGTAYFGGGNGAGMLWTISTINGYVDLADFGGTGSDASPGQLPDCLVTLDSLGDVYGTTQMGGSNEFASDGVVWELSFASLLNSGFSPSDVTGGVPANGVVTLTSPAPTKGVVVKLASNSTDATVPATVTVAPGKKSATYVVTTKPVGTPTTATIIASFGKISKPAKLTISPPTLASVTADPMIVQGGTSATASVVLTGPAPYGGIAIKMTSNSPDVVPPTTVSVPGGKTSQSFLIRTAEVANPVSAGITATLGTTNKITKVEIETLLSVALSPISVIAGETSRGTVNLWQPAPTGGFSVALSTSSTSVTVPKTVTVPAGSKSAAFNITTSPSTVGLVATITGRFGGYAQSQKLTVVSLAGLTLSPAIVGGGGSSNATVTLTAPAPVGGAKVTLSTSSSDAVLPGAITIPAGSKTYTFSIKTKNVLSKVSSTITATLASLSKTATLTITE